MALIICPECGKQISDKCDVCVHCGFPLTRNEDNISNLKQPPITPPSRHTHKQKGKFAKKKKKKPIYLRWWFVVLTIIALLIIVISIMPKGEKIIWDDMALGEMLPEPPAGRGDVYDNGRDELDITILDGISDKQYNDYVTQCENMGFNVDVRADTYSYEAHNTDGYKLRLSHSSYDENLRIHLTAPIEMGEIQWPVGTIGSILPKPNSTIGDVEYESDDVFRAYIGDITEDEYFEYIATCADNGFNVEISKQDRWYRVENSEGWRLIIEYEGFNIMKIDITAPDDDTEETKFTATETQEEAIVDDESDYNNSDDYDTDYSYTPTHYCEVSGCYKEGTKTYLGLSGRTEYYCYAHYNEMMDIIDMMESDVGQGSASKHTCEECSNEGTHSIIGISGMTEYYCTKHYEELKELLEIFG